MPHSKPPFWTTLFDGVGTQVEVDAEVDWAADEEAGGDVCEKAEADVAEDAREDIAVTTDVGGVEDVNEEKEGLNVENTAEVAGDTELEV